MNREPVLTASILTGLILSGLTFLAQRGVINWTADDASALAEFLGYAAPIVIVLVGGFIARYFVTPVSDPRDMDGAPLNRADGQDPIRAR